MLITWNCDKERPNYITNDHTSMAHFLIYSLLTHVVISRHSFAIVALQLFTLLCSTRNSSWNNCLHSTTWVLYTLMTVVTAQYVIRQRCIMINDWCLVFLLPIQLGRNRLWCKLLMLCRQYALLTHSWVIMSIFVSIEIEHLDFSSYQLAFMCVLCEFHFYSFLEWSAKKYNPQNFSCKPNTNLQQNAMFV